MQVVDREHERVVSGEVEDEPVEAVQRGEAVERVASASPVTRTPGAPPRPRRRKRRSRAAGSASAGSKSWRTTPNGNAALELRTARRQHPHAVALRETPRLSEQGGLADPGRSFDQAKPWACPADAGDELIERPDLTLTLQKHAAMLMRRGLLRSSRGVELRLHRLGLVR